MLVSKPDPPSAALGVIKIASAAEGGSGFETSILCMAGCCGWGSPLARAGGFVSCSVRSESDLPTHHPSLTHVKHEVLYDSISSM